MLRIKSALGDIVRALPYIRRLHAQINRQKLELAQLRTKFPPGHFYSPVPSLEEIKNDWERISQPFKDSIAGIDLNAEEQLSLLRSFGEYYPQIPSEWSNPGQARYQFANEYYSWADAITLYSMLRHLKPKRVVEVGSGYSSAVILDTAERYLNGAVECTFIDPNPERLHGLLSDRDRRTTTIIEQRVQDVPLDIFVALEPGDFLIIDSSHVSKTGSDLNHLLFEITPQLAAGVHIHFHDIFFPFEYPRAWVDAGVAWNEAYILRAFLMFNRDFIIEFFTSYLVQSRRTLLEALTPSMLNSEPAVLSFTDAPGASIWLRRAG